MSDPFNTRVGVRQGCLLSPRLFNLFFERIVARALKGLEELVSICGRRINNFRFADDIDLIVGTPAKLADLTDRLDKASSLYGMKITTEQDRKKDRLIITVLQQSLSGLIVLQSTKRMRQYELR